MRDSAERGHKASGSDVRARITDTGKLRKLLANGVSHRAAAHALKVPERTIRRAVRQDVALEPHVALGAGERLIALHARERIGGDHRTDDGRQLAGVADRERRSVIGCRADYEDVNAR